MSKWEYIDDGKVNRHAGRKINKELFCKKNKLGHGRYGFHVYEDGKFCKFCEKKNPVTKRRGYKE